MNIYCNNCGNRGHIYKECRYPVLSYGIICFNKNKEILMIQRKDSINYIEFLRGKYKLNDNNYIIHLLNGCSVKERDKLISIPFDILWKNLWFLETTNRPQTERMIREYHKSKSMFNRLDINSLLKECNKLYETPEWELPKGRRSSREKDIDCAIREFEEETNLTNDDYTIISNLMPTSEEYIGSNGVRYKHIYYYAMFNSEKQLTINKDKYEQYSEISDIDWVHIQHAADKIRPDYPFKKQVINDASKLIYQWSNDYFLKE
tara:strand:- start:3888 stop:4673 length:786 start_codon:yes stop_codon:yes gene_type:complete